MQKINKVLLLFLLLTLVSNICFAQSKKKLDPLDAAIRETSDYLNANIAKGSRIVILNIQSDSGALSEYIIDELISNAVNDRVFMVVDRQQLDAIRAEQNFQFSGEVDDKQALEIGKFLGASSIVSGAVNPYGKDYRLRVRALEVQTALVQGQFNKNISKSIAITTLLSSKTNTSTTSASTNTKQTIPATTAPASSTTSADNIISANAGWLKRINGGNDNVKQKSEAIILFGSETIQNRLVNVMTLKVNLAKENIWRIGQFENYNNAIINKLKTANGIRFFVLGDGAAGWKILLLLNNIYDDTYHEAGFSTKNGQVTQVDIPFSKFKQPDWEGRQKVSFNKNNINGLLIQRYAGDGSSISGVSTIKIFDFEIY